MYLLRFVTLVPHIPERTRISDTLSRVNHQLSQCLRESSVKMSVLPHSFIHSHKGVCANERAWLLKTTSMLVFQYFYDTSV